MLKLAEYLSIGLKEVRVDFYEVRGKIYFGEFTFYSNAGIDNTITEQADIELGANKNKETNTALVILK